IALPRPGGRAPEGRGDATLREPDLQRLLVVPGEKDAADDDRCLASPRERPRAPEALQGQRDGRRPYVENRFAVRPGDRDLRRRSGGVRPEGCGRVHQAQCLAAADRNDARPQVQITSDPDYQRSLSTVSGTVSIIM